MGRPATNPPTPFSNLKFSIGYAIVLIGAVLIVTAPFAIGNDGLVRLETLEELLVHGTLNSNKYSLYGPVVATPFWLVGTWIGLTNETAWTFNRVVFLAGLVGLWFTLRPGLSHQERLRFVSLLLFGSMFPWHVTYFFAEVFHAVCVGLGLALLATRQGWRAWVGGGLAAWGTANVPASSVGLALAACVLCWHRHQFRYLAIPAAAAVLILLENWVRRGDPLVGGYAGEAGNVTVMPYSGRPGFSYPLFFGLLAVLFSFGKGLVFFVPGLFARYPEAGPELAVTREIDVRMVYRLWLAVVVGLVLVYARWWAWYGGGVWGPRFFLFACLPASLVLARWSARPECHSLGANLLLLVAVALSCWVGTNGLVYVEYDHALFRDNDFALEYLTWYVPECSVLWRPFVVAKPLNWAERIQLVASALGFAYLAWPVARVLAGQVLERMAGTWQTVRNGPHWRF